MRQSIYHLQLLSFLSITLSSAVMAKPLALDKPAKDSHPSHDDSADISIATRAMAQFDTDSDGTIDKWEATTFKSANAELFNQAFSFDMDRDGRLSRVEVAAWVSADGKSSPLVGKTGKKDPAADKGKTPKNK
jgi:EF hand